MKRRQNYIDYDYEEAYKKQCEALEEDNIKRMMKNGYVRSVYATKEIKAGNQLEVEIYPEFTRGQKELIPEEGRVRKSRQAQKNLNEKNSRKMCERIINANFTDRDIWATFTYTDKEMPNSYEEAQDNMKRYIRRLNYQRGKRGLDKARYVYTIECSDKGRWHHHIVLDGDIDMDTVESIWQKGKRNEVRRLHRDENGLTGMAKYISKQKAADAKKKGKQPDQEESKYKKTWTSSKGLKQPEETKNHYKFKQKDINEVVTGQQNIQDKLKRWYPDYEFTEADIRHNGFNGKFYIYCRLRCPLERIDDEYYKKAKQGAKRKGKGKSKKNQKGKAHRKVHHSSSCASGRNGNRQADAAQKNGTGADSGNNGKRTDRNGNKQPRKKK